MNLFDDTELFASGELKITNFNLPDADLVLYEHFFSKEASDYYYNSLLNTTPWHELDWEIYGNTHKVPRMVKWYEDPENFGALPETPELTPDLKAIRKKIEDEVAISFNSVLLNLYRNGNDGVGWHSDRTENFGQNAIIGSVSFGETRPFRLRHKIEKDLKLEIPLYHGSFLLMAGTMQTFWEHQIPKTAKDILPRINLTFRRVRRNTV
ncbi:MAG TPA: alpha-ketoglutarate-dependent dioxygenase AlkB [Flavobacterium sp.]|nr:alpha-ketoglutarate-dependent dioxygenase AlkB [Flavobacterium sp.]